MTRCPNCDKTLRITLAAGTVDAQPSPAPSPAVSTVKECLTVTPPSPSPDSVLKVAEELLTWANEHLADQTWEGCTDFVDRLFTVAKSTPSPQASDLADRLEKWLLDWDFADMNGEQLMKRDAAFAPLIAELRTLSAPKPSERAEEVAAELEEFLHRPGFYQLGLSAVDEMNALVARVRLLSPAPSPGAMPASVEGLLSAATWASDKLGVNADVRTNLVQAIAAVRALYSPPAAKDGVLVYFLGNGAEERYNRLDNQLRMHIAHIAEQCNKDQFWNALAELGRLHLTMLSRLRDRVNGLERSPR